MLRWADNPRNTVAAFRVLQLLPGLGPANARKAIEHFEASRPRIRSRCRPSRAAGLGRAVAQAHRADGSPSAIRERQWPGQVHLAREWYRPHFERIYEHFHTRIGDLDQLELLSGQYPSRERFLTELTLDPPNATSDLAGQRRMPMRTI